MEKLFFFIIALALAYGIGCMGRKRRIGFGFAFFLAILNVFIGLIAVLLSKKKDEVEFVDMDNKSK